MGAPDSLFTESTTMFLILAVTPCLLLLATGVCGTGLQRQFRDDGTTYYQLGDGVSTPKRQRSDTAWSTTAVDASAEARIVLPKERDSFWWLPFPMPLTVFTYGGLVSLSAATVVGYVLAAGFGIALIATIIKAISLWRA